MNQFLDAKAAHNASRHLRALVEQGRQRTGGNRPPGKVESDTGRRAARAQDLGGQSMPTVAVLAPGGPRRHAGFFIVSNCHVAGPPAGLLVTALRAGPVTGHVRRPDAALAGA
jgi:hypothetical protein